MNCGFGNTAAGRHRPITHYQTGGGGEIDFVVETRNRQPDSKPLVVCIEVKHAVLQDGTCRDD
jgi:hypothetical protein